MPSLQVMIQLLFHTLLICAAALWGTFSCKFCNLLGIQELP